MNTFLIVRFEKQHPLNKEKIKTRVVEISKFPIAAGSVFGVTMHLTSSS